MSFWAKGTDGVWGGDLVANHIGLLPAAGYVSGGRHNRTARYPTREYLKGQFVV